MTDTNSDITEVKRRALAYADAKDAKRGGVEGEGTKMLREHIALIESLDCQLTAERGRFESGDPDRQPTEGQDIATIQVSITYIALKARVAQLEKDAARYRWLRAEHKLVRGTPLAAVSWKVYGDRNSSDWANIFNEKELDSLIDAELERGTND